MKAPRTLLVTAFVLPFFLGGCSTETPTQTPDPHLQDGSAKAQPHSTSWVGRALPFVHNLHVHDMAATPTRMLATTLNHDDKLVTVNEQGVIGTFSFEFTAAADAECYVAISPGWKPGLPTDDVWVTRENELFRLSPLGDQMVAVAALPVEQGDIAGLCFDHIGTFGYALLLLSEAGSIYTLAAETAPLAFLGHMGPGGRAPSVASPAFGTHAGNLMVSYPEEDVVRAMDEDGLVSYVVGWSGVTSAATVPEILREFGRSRGAYFVALDNGTVYRFANSDIAPLSGELLVASRYRSGSGVVTPNGVGYSMRAFSRFWGPEVCTTVVQRPAVTVIEVVAENGISNPSFVQGSQTLISVTLLSSPWFWPNQVDFDSVTLADAAPVAFGKGGIGNWVDMNDDGSLDLTLFFRPADMQTPIGSVALALDGRTMAMEAFEATATFTVTAP